MPRDGARLGPTHALLVLGAEGAADHLCVALSTSQPVGSKRSRPLACSMPFYQAHTVRREHAADSALAQWVSGLSGGLAAVAASGAPAALLPRLYKLWQQQASGKGAVGTVADGVPATPQLAQTAGAAAATPPAHGVGA